MTIEMESKDFGKMYAEVDTQTGECFLEAEKSSPKMFALPPALLATLQMASAMAEAAAKDQSFINKKNLMDRVSKGRMAELCEVVLRQSIVSPDKPVEPKKPAETPAEPEVIEN